MRLYKATREAGYEDLEAVVLWARDRRTALRTLREEYGDRFAIPEKEWDIELQKPPVVSGRIVHEGWTGS